MKNLTHPIKTISIVIALCFINTIAVSQTSIQPSTLSSAHWTLSGSPYKIMGHIIVANGDSLIIDPGVVVEFQGKYKLFCNGKIIANGTPTQRILFTVPVANRNTGWLGIRYDNTPTTNGQSSFNYCTIEYGRADITGDNQGGGMYFNKFSNCTISNSIFQNCYADAGGGAIYALDASPTILRDSFYNNSYRVQGGSVFLANSSSVIDSCLFMDAGVVCGNSSAKITNNNFIKCIKLGGVSSFCNNPSLGYLEITHNVFDSCSQINGSGGGAILLSNAQAKIEHNIFKNNVSANGGGAISCWTQHVYTNSSNTIISNNLFYGNKSHYGIGGNPFGGGAINFSNCSGKVINNTIVNNTSDTAGGAIFCSTGSSPSFYNNIIYGNSTDDTSENIFIIDNSSDPNFYNNNLEGGYSAINTNGTPLVGANVNTMNFAPNFTNPSAGIYTLNTGSPCIDSGTTTGIATLIPALDLAGNTRITNTHIDLGAYETGGTTNSILEVTGNMTISIYPNPARNSFGLSGLQPDDLISVQIFDMLGRQVAYYNLITSNNFDVSNLSKGIFLVKINANNEHSKTLRLFKE